MKDSIFNLYNNAMHIAENVAINNETISDVDKALILDSVGALLESIGIAKFNGVYTLADLKRDVKEVK